MKVLIVEDSIDFAKPLLDFFKIDGHNTEHSDNLANAEAYLKVSKFDIILLDIMLPDGDGRNLLKKIRKQNLNTPVIIMTAKSEVSDKIDLLDIGADDYITKPIKPKVLKSKIKSLLRRLSQEERDLIKIGSLVIDRSGYKVSLNGKDISLPRKEFELLFLLCSKPEKVFKREFILESVWGKDVVVGDRTIDVHIRKLREKIGDSYFKTVKGVGYKFQN